MRLEVIEILNELIPKINAELAINANSDFLESLDSDTITDITCFIDNVYELETYSNIHVHLVFPNGIKPTHKDNTRYIRQFWLRVTFANSDKSAISPSFSMYKNK